MVTLSRQTRPACAWAACRRASRERGLTMVRPTPYLVRLQGEMDGCEISPCGSLLAAGRLPLRTDRTIQLKIQLWRLSQDLLLCSMFEAEDRLTTSPPRLIFHVVPFVPREKVLRSTGYAVAAAPLSPNYLLLYNSSTSLIGEFHMHANFRPALDDPTTPRCSRRPRLSILPS